ncbi:formylglycine-generating enzyme family protein [Leucobacter insecticola]|uniref:Formylglycine-generating enzyme family protein n=1 Tax=Leucobacter insecticola TaxID=2714934 RepID=A0A6G8FGG2_9MICO|nr:SUMF1/EgtB/PvdO family nonheme iron enzyme [Leucobacter insecticola]QIM15606.1 formylglycine-generating enzyme family protein [Leucobacter insecticola]
MQQFVEIPAGAVHLNDARRGESRTVQLRSFQIGVVPVTVGTYAPAASSAEAPLPATGVRWIDAVRWCISAAEAEGIPPAYAVQGDEVLWDLAADGCRLPTEAEWVRACRAGSSGARYGELPDIAWTAADAVEGPQPVGLKQPNTFGVYDMLGNAWEWCWDRLDPARYGDYRLLKGGGWADPEWSCRAGVRRGDSPTARLEDVGFRVVRGAAGPEGQGWSETVDRARAAITGPRPVGWTPLR